MDPTRQVKHPRLVGVKLSFLYPLLPERKKAKAIPIREGFATGILALGRGKQPL